MAQDLLDLIETAQHQLEYYKRPDVDEVQERLDQILKAGGLSGISWDKLESLDIRNDTLYIRTSYEVRCCAQTGSFEIPMVVVMADDPISEMKKLAKEREFEKVRQEVIKTKAAYDVALEKLKRLND